MRPKYRVLVAVEANIEVFATSASGAWETAQAIALEMVKAKGFTPGKAVVHDIYRVYPPENRESAVDCMSIAAHDGPTGD